MSVPEALMKMALSLSLFLLLPSCLCAINVNLIHETPAALFEDSTPWVQQNEPRRLTFPAIGSMKPPPGVYVKQPIGNSIPYKKVRTDGSSVTSSIDGERNKKVTASEQDVIYEATIDMTKKVAHKGKGTCSSSFRPDRTDLPGGRTTNGTSPVSIRPPFLQTIVALTGHKTGSEFFKCVLHELSIGMKMMTSANSRSIDHQKARLVGMYHFNYQSWNSDGRSLYGPYRMVKLTRHPLDRYLSSDRFHRTATEAWLNRRADFVMKKVSKKKGIPNLTLFDLKNCTTCARWNFTAITTYQGFLNSLSKRDSLMFTMYTLADSYNDDWRFNNLTADVLSVNVKPIGMSGNTLATEDLESMEFTIKAEDCRTNWNSTLNKIMEALVPENCAQNIHVARSKINDKCAFSTQSKKTHSSLTRIDAELLLTKRYDFVGKLECVHYLYFERFAGGKEAIRMFGYEDSLEIYDQERARVCEGEDLVTLSSTLEEFPKFMLHM